MGKPNPKHKRKRCRHEFERDLDEIVPIAGSDWYHHTIAKTCIKCGHKTEPRTVRARDSMGKLKKI